MRIRACGVADVAEPGSFVTHDEARVPLLVVRGEDGVVRAFLNVCRHRGVRLVNVKRGVALTFVCWQHAWTYDTKGCFGPEKDENALVELPVAIEGDDVIVDAASQAGGG